MKTLEEYVGEVSGMVSQKTLNSQNNQRVLKLLYQTTEKSQVSKKRLSLPDLYRTEVYMPLINIMDEMNHREEFLDEDAIKTLVSADIPLLEEAIMVGFLHWVEDSGISAKKEEKRENQIKMLEKARKKVNKASPFIKTLLSKNSGLSPFVREKISQTPPRNLIRLIGMMKNEDIKEMFLSKRSDIINLYERLPDAASQMKSFHDDLSGEEKLMHIINILPEENKSEKMTLVMNYLAYGMATERIGTTGDLEKRKKEYKYIRSNNEDEDLSIALNNLKDEYPTLVEFTDSVIRSSMSKIDVSQQQLTFRIGNS